MFCCLCWGLGGREERRWKYFYNFYLVFFFVLCFFVSFEYVKNEMGGSKRNKKHTQKNLYPTAIVFSQERKPFFFFFFIDIFNIYY